MEENESMKRVCLDNINMQVIVINEWGKCDQFFFFLSAKNEIKLRGIQKGYPNPFT